MLTNPVSLHSCIVTCGSDGDVRIWENLDDDDPKSINVGEKAYSCALKVGLLTQLLTVVDLPPDSDLPPDCGSASSVMLLLWVTTNRNYL